MASVTRKGREVEKLPPINSRQRYSRNPTHLLLLHEGASRRSRHGSTSKERKASSAAPERLPLCCTARSRATAPGPAPKRSTPSLTQASPTIPHPHAENPLRKFRKTARMVKNQIAWTKGLARDAEAHLKTYTVQTQGGDQPESLTFNLNAFKPEVQSCGTLNPRVKTILMKPSFNRSEEELAFLHRFTQRLKCFDRYPLYVRKELASVLYYEAFEKGRVVIRQGDSGFNFYFIVSGSVLVEVQEEDPLTGAKHNMVVGELGSGAAFGELALLHDDKRRATIVCKEPAEFLRVDKPDFDMVLRKNHEREWEMRLNHLKSHRFFREWTPDRLNLIVEGSQIVEYPSNTVIIKDLSQTGDVIYFLTKGNCKVVQKIELVESAGNPELARMTLPPIGRTAGNKPKRKAPQRVKRWWVLRTLVPGDYFGVGEGKGKAMSVISDHKVECLLVNKMPFLKHERGKCLAMMQEEAAKLYPSRDRVLQSYMESKRWNDYKQKVVLEAMAQGPRHLSTNSWWAT